MKYSKLLKYPANAYSILFLWLLTFLLMGSLTNKANYQTFSIINFILQAIEILALSACNLYYYRKKHYPLIFLNVLVLLFFLFVFLIPESGGDAIIRL